MIQLATNYISNIHETHIMNFVNTNVFLDQKDKRL